MNSCSHSGISEFNGLPRSIVVSSGCPDRSSTEVDTCTGWDSIPLRYVIDVEGWELEEELDDKPGTTIGTKFSVSHCIRTPFFRWDVVFDSWSIRRNTRFQRKAFRAIIPLACSRGLSLSRIYPILWHKLWPLHASALLHWLLWLSWDYTISSKYPFQQNSSPSCWSYASTRRSRQQILVPQV